MWMISSDFRTATSLASMKRGPMRWMVASAVMASVLTVSVVTVACGKSGGGSDSSSLGSAVNSNTEILGTWDLTGFSIQDYPQDQIAFSGRASLRLRADGGILTELVAYSSSFAGDSLHGRCTGYESGKFTVANGILTRTDTVVVGVSGDCHDIKASPGAKKVEDVALKAFLTGSTLNLTSETTTLEQGVSKKITILRTFTKRADETWDGSGIDSALSGTYKISKIYADYSCKSDASDRFKGTLSLGGSLILKITGNKYTETRTGFKIGAIDACTAVTNGTIEPNTLSNNWAQTDSSHECAKKEPDPDVIVHFDREIIGMPSGAYVSIVASSYPHETCENGYSQDIDISVFERQ